MARRTSTRDSRTSTRDNRRAKNLLPHPEASKPTAPQNVENESLAGGALTPPDSNHLASLPAPIEPLSAVQTSITETKKDVASPLADEMPSSSLISNNKNVQYYISIGRYQEKYLSSAQPDNLSLLDIPEIQFLIRYEYISVKNVLAYPPHIKLCMQEQKGCHLLLKSGYLKEDQLLKLTSNQVLALNDEAIAQRIIADKKDLNEFLRERVEPLCENELFTILGYKIEVTGYPASGCPDSYCYQSDRDPQEVSKFISRKNDENNENELLRNKQKSKSERATLSKSAELKSPLVTNTPSTKADAKDSTDSSNSSVKHASKEINPNDAQWKRILNTRIGYILCPLPEDKCTIKPKVIYIHVTEKDNSKFLSYEFISLDNKVVKDKIAWEKLPKEFPQTLEETCANSSALSAILSLTPSMRPEQELQSLFKKAQDLLGNEFTIRKRNELLGKFDTGLLIHTGKWFQGWIVNTGSYRKVVDTIRKNALDQLHFEINKIKISKNVEFSLSEADKVEINNDINQLLNAARKMPIFKSHRNNFCFTGAWGRTHAVSEIDSLLKIYPLKEAPQGERRVVARSRF